MLFCWPSGQTTNLASHLKSAHDLTSSTTSSVSNQPNISAILQPSVSAFVPLTKARSSDITKVVETQPFVKMLKVAEPRYQLPTKKTLKTNILDKMQVDMSAEICRDIQTLENLALTHDSWTSLANHSYETVTVHYCLHNWQVAAQEQSTVNLEIGRLSQLWSDQGITLEGEENMEAA